MPVVKSTGNLHNGISYISTMDTLYWISPKHYHYQWDYCSLAPNNWCKKLSEGLKKNYTSDLVSTHKMRCHYNVVQYCMKLHIGLLTLTSVASDLLNDALRLDNELSVWAATVSYWGDNIGQWATHSLIKWLTSTASILSLVLSISQNFLYDVVKSVPLIVTKSWSDKTSQWSVTAKLKYAILQWANKDPATIFTCMRERHLR